jgi:hypothetical protein
MLLGRGADVNTEGEHGNALQSGLVGGYIKVVHMHLEHGANVYAEEDGLANALQG